MPTAFTKDGTCSKGCARGVDFYMSCRTLCAYHKKEAVNEQRWVARVLAAMDGQGEADSVMEEVQVDKAAPKRARELESVVDDDGLEKKMRLTVAEENDLEVKMRAVLENALKTEQRGRRHAEAELKLAKDEIQRLQSQRGVFEEKLLGVENAAQHEKNARESFEFKLKERSPSVLQTKMEIAENRMLAAENNAQKMETKVETMEAQQKNLQSTNTLLFAILNMRLADALSQL